MSKIENRGQRTEDRRRKTGNGKLRFTIGIDFGATQVKLGAVDKKGNILTKKVIKTPRNIPPREFIGVAKRETQLLLKTLGRSNCLGIGIGVPGLVDFSRGVVLYLVNVKGWKNVPLARDLKQAVRLPVYVDNDVNAMTLGELAFGAGRGCRDLVCLTLGTGVGGGIVINGNLYRGATHSAGEMGHVVIEENGKECACGGKGCVEAYIGNQQIVALTQGRFGSPKALSDAASQGDPIAISIWRQVGIHLGVALTSVVNLLNPEKIVIGGGVANAGELLFYFVRQTVKERAMKGPADSVRIVKAQLGEDAGIVGAAVLAEFDP